MKEIADDFISNAFNLSKCKDDKFPINSFVVIVSLLEVRHRSRPECFDYSNSSLLLHYFLLSLYYKYHNSQIDIKSNDPLFNLVLLIIKSNSPIDKFKSFVKNLKGGIVIP